MTKNARFALALGLVLVAAPSVAQDPILTVTGAGSDAEISFTRDDLLDLPQHQVATNTSVTDGTVEFEGFLMRDLLETYPAEGEVVVAAALNDYRIEIPISDFERFDVIGALSMDGAALSPRDKGPVWIVYPRDDHPELQDIRYDTRWVWQLTSLHVQ
ncbi:molybdopterin-dependent oxidoreductase [Roseovarius sp. D0-M9]|uniref:molybdopterin-dependent oxidoreductase n=1 Tax=Roseovarius sp. D0-M9 TaxID=3127117 RepID=UPI00301043AF